jgi:hypothetical protein
MKSEVRSQKFVFVKGIYAPFQKRFLLKGKVDWPDCFDNY